MTTETWVRVTSCDNIPLREGRSVVVGGRELAIFNLGDRFVATENRCPHRAGPLCDGIVTGVSVVCPLHAWKVNLTSGSVERPAGAAERCVQTFPTRVDDGIVSVSLPRTARGRTGPADPRICGAGPASSSVPADPPAVPADPPRPQRAGNSAHLLMPRGTAHGRAV